MADKRDTGFRARIDGQLMNDRQQYRISQVRVVETIGQWRI